MQTYAVQEAVLAPGICWTQQQESRAFCLDNTHPVPPNPGYYITPAYKPNYCAPSFVCPGRIFTLETARMVLFNLQWSYDTLHQYAWTGLPSQIQGRVRDELIMLIANFLQLCPSNPLGACAVWDNIVVPTVRIFSLNVTDDVEYIYPNGTVIPARLHPAAQLNGTQVLYQWREVFGLDGIRNLDCRVTDRGGWNLSKP